MTKIMKIYPAWAGGEQGWKKLTERDCREWELTTVDPQERSTWRSGGVQLASNLEGASLMWMMPLPLHVNQKSDYGDDTYMYFL